MYQKNRGRSYETWIEFFVLVYFSCSYGLAGEYNFEITVATGPVVICLSTAKSSHCQRFLKINVGSFLFHP